MDKEQQDDIFINPEDINFDDGDEYWWVTTMKMITYLKNDLFGQKE